MTETVSYDITLTHARIAELLDVPVAVVPALLADVDPLGSAGPIGGANDLLDEIGCDTHRAGSAGCRWAVRAVTATGPLPFVPPITDPPDITAGLLADASDHSDYRAGR